MPSHLRLQASFEPFNANATYQPSTPTSPPSKKQKMSLTQTYYVASTARSKLGHEASRADHNLRRLVGHANLLDGLMVTLADAEREQEAWFNHSVKQTRQKPQHIQWVDTIQEDSEEAVDSDSDDSDDSDDEYDEDAELFNIPVRQIRTPAVTVTSEEIDEDEEMYDDDDDNMMPTLTRVASVHSPPELTHDSSDSEDEDEGMPSSPEQATTEMEFGEKERETIATTTSFYDQKAGGLEDYIMEHAQQQPQAPLIAAC